MYYRRGLCTKLFRAGCCFWRPLCSCFVFHPLLPSLLPYMSLCWSQEPVLILSCLEECLQAMISVLERLWKRMAKRWNSSMEWAPIQPWRSMQEGLLNTGMNSIQEQLQWAIYPLTSGAELCKRLLLETGPCLYSHLGSCYQHLQQQIWGRDDIKGETGRRSWGWLAECNCVHLIAASAACCHCSTSCTVWEVIRHCSDLPVSRDVYELNAGTWHTRLQFLALCLSRLGVLLVYGFLAGLHAPFCLQKVGACWIDGQLGFSQYGVELHL